MSEFTSDQIRHSAAHIMAMAVSRLFPDVKVGIGPVTKEGFYYDFEFSSAITWEQTKRIESEMNLIIQEDLTFSQIIVPKESAFQILLTRGQVYKAELLQEVPDNDISFFKLGDEFIDLCRGPHVRSTGDIGAIKITSLSTVHWRNKQERPKMQRITGVAFRDLQELRDYMAREEEIQSRDFRILAREMSINMGGSKEVIYTPKGTKIIRAIGGIILGNIIEDSDEINIPNYRSIKGLNKSFTDVFGRKNRSYRELPLKLFTSSRLELNQPITIMKKDVYSTNIIMNKVFIDQIQFHTQLTNMIRSTIDTLKSLNLDFSASINVPSQTHMGLEISSNQLQRSGIPQTQIIDASMQPHQMAIDFKAKDSFDREWELLSLRVDADDSQFVTKTGDFSQSLQISQFWIIERIIAFYLEEYEGGFPVWLSPIQAVIIPITEDQNDYATHIYKKLKEEGLRVDIDPRSETMQSRIRDAELQKVPAILIIGEKETSTKTASLRVRGKAEVGLVSEETLFDTLNKIKI